MNHTPETVVLLSDYNINNLLRNHDDFFGSFTFHPFGCAFMGKSHLFHFAGRHISRQFDVETSFSVK